MGPLPMNDALDFQTSRPTRNCDRAYNIREHRLLNPKPKTTTLNPKIGITMKKN